MRYEDDSGFIEFGPLLMPDRYEFLGDVGFNINKTSNEELMSFVQDLSVMAKFIRFAGKHCKKMDVSIEGDKFTSWDELSGDHRSAGILTQASLKFCFGGMGGASEKKPRKGKSKPM